MRSPGVLEGEYPAPRRSSITNHVNETQTDGFSWVLHSRWHGRHRTSRRQPQVYRGIPMDTSDYPQSSCMQYSLRMSFLPHREILGSISCDAAPSDLSTDAHRDFFDEYVREYVCLFYGMPSDIVEKYLTHELQLYNVPLVRITLLSCLLEYSEHNTV